MVPAQSSVRRWLVALLLFSLILPNSRAAEVRTDLDADISRDGVIDDDDPKDNGYVQNNPPGLPVTVGALEKLALRCTPKSVAKGYVRLSVVSGPEAWKALQNPRWQFRPRPANGGHIRIWKDPGKTTLILDSHDLAKQTSVWHLSYNAPLAFVPHTLYVEGVVASKEGGDVVLALEYGPVASAAKGTRDILVATVTKAPKPQLVEDNTSRGGPQGEPGGVNAEQLAIWTFDGSPTFVSGRPMAPTAEDVVGVPTMTMLNADIDGNGKGGIAYTDVENVPHALTTAAAWNDIKKNNAPDAEFRVTMATTGWEDIELRFDYKSESADNFRLDYSIDGGTQWTPATTAAVGLTDGYTWQALPHVDLSSIDAIEDLPSVIFRFYDLKATGNDKFVFDNLEFIGTKILGVTGPTIEVATTTTPYLSLPTQNQGYVSGVIGDPTCPARTLGIDFTLADPDTPVDQLTVTAVSVPANQVQLALTGTGANWNLKITPLLVGYANINVKVTDGTDSSTYVVRYAASAVAPNPAGPRFHTGVSDISAATEIDANTMLAANDEDRSLWLYHRTSSGLHRKEIQTGALLGLTSARETDVEGCARDGALAYWIGSHGNNTDGEYRDNRCRLFGTTISGTGDQASASVTGYYADLRRDLVAWDANNLHGKGPDYYGFAASTVATTATIVGVEPKRDDGFNIEGLAMGATSSTVYVGFRAPIVPASARTKALIVPVTNIQALVSGSPATGPATFGPPIELDLGGRGVRSMAKTASGGYLIVAGPTTNATGTPPSDFRLYSWSGNPLAVPALLQNDLTGLSTGGSFEAIVEPVGGVDGDVELLNDNGTTDWYGDGAESKTLNANWQKFRSDWVVPGPPVPATPFLMTMGGTGDDGVRAAVHTLDGGSVVVGYTNSPEAGGYNVWIGKLDRASDVVWQKTYGATGCDCYSPRFFALRPSIRQTLDGGYIVVMNTRSLDTGTLPKARTKVWVLRLTADGGIVWTKTYSAARRDYGAAVAVCSDGSFVVGANSYDPEARIWILKLRADGTILWQSLYGTSASTVREIEETAGGDLLVNGIVQAPGTPCLFRLSPAGAIRWATAYGSSAAQENHAVPTSGGGCVVVSGRDACCVQKIDADGSTAWHRTYVGPGKEGENETLVHKAWAIDETPDKGFIVGTVCTRQGTVDSEERALLRLDSNGAPVWCRSYRSLLRDKYMHEYLRSLTACPDGTYILAGQSRVSETTRVDMLILRVKADGTVPGLDSTLVNVTGQGPPPGNGGVIDLKRRATNVTVTDVNGLSADASVSPAMTR